ncbi:27190_t:CDS:2, partial [Gigaspora margarita]
HLKQSKDLVADKEKPKSQPFKKNQSLCLLQEADEEAKRATNNKKEKKSSHSKMNSMGDRKEEKEYMKLEQQHIREEKWLEKK